MKKHFLAILLCAIFPLIAPFPVFAASEARQPKNVVLDKSEVVNKDYFAAGDNLTISGTIFC